MKRDIQTSLCEALSRLESEMKVLRDENKILKESKGNEWHSYAERPKQKLNALCYDIGQHNGYCCSRNNK